MAIITISRGCCSYGKAIAECAAKKLGYECISQEVLLEAARFFHVPEEKLFESLHDAPGFMERLTHVRQHFINDIQAALLEHVAKDNVVYHGFAGQMLLADIPHVLKVRVIVEMEDRVKLLMDRQQISRQEAIRLIEHEDHERAEWYRIFYRIDMNDPRVYDLVLHIGRLTIDDACDIVCRTAASRSFSTTPESVASLGDLALESHVKIALDGICKADIQCRAGVVHLRVKGQKLVTTGVASPHVQHQVKDQIREDVYDNIIKIVSDIPGVKDIDCTIETPYYA